jgi:quercetin dioxygenase-like cupin family protein
MKDETQAIPIIRNGGEGERRWFAGGGLFTMKLTTAETGGAFFLIEDDVVRGKTTPYHRHEHEDEFIYVLEGELLVNVEGTESVVKKGGVMFAPRGCAHSFLVTSETARLLGLQTPGSGEVFYRKVSDPSTSPDDAARPPDIARVQAGAKETGRVDLLGPPPFKR